MARPASVRGTTRHQVLAPCAVVFVVALIARVTLVLCRGGYGGSPNYDSGVYFAAADALIHGRLPYQDFTLVHPPVSMLVLTPFAALGTATSDQTGLVVASVAFSVLGALAAVLVVLVVRELVESRVARWIGGLGYALWIGSVRAEIEPRLEPLANVLLLFGLLCMLRAPRSRWWVSALGGVALAASVSTKVWYAAPAVIVLAGYLAARRRSRLGAALGGVVVGALAIDGPFFVAAPRAMVRSIVVDQFSRPAVRTGPVLRLTELSGLPQLQFSAEAFRAEPATAVVTGAVLALLVLLTLLNAVPRAGRAGALVAVMLVVQVVVLLRSPSYFRFYDDYVTPAAAVCFGVSVGVVSAFVRARVRTGLRAPLRAVAVVGSAGVTVWLLVLSASYPAPVVDDYPASFASAAARSRCVMSDDPQVLIRIDALSRGLAAGCRDWIDVSGRRLGPDRPRRTADGGLSDRTWQRDFARYLLSGDAVALHLPKARHLSGRLMRVLAHAPVLARSGSSSLIQITERQRAQYRDGATTRSR